MPPGRVMGGNETHRESPEAEKARHLHTHSLVGDATPTSLFPSVLSHSSGLSSTTPPPEAHRLGYIQVSDLGGQRPRLPCTVGEVAHFTVA